MLNILIKVDNYLKFKKVKKLEKEGRQVITIHEGKDLTGWIVL